ncbi:uncharacterized protein LOC124289150 [Haliotis rubra]|uniref:uncharacterized protein LOC124289150 n=1 Tax=Haliotis rubra TaxID=36100 RepID=UPI001EE5CB8D|nr:uncharacterized protein LOC124289150 [Haliotis rubra]
MTCERFPEMSGHDDKDQGSPSQETGTQVFTMDSGTGQELTIPTADVVVDPPDGLKAWCLVFVVMILACLRGTFIELMPQVLLFMGSTNNTSSGGAGHIEIFPVLPVEAQTVDNTYKALYSVSVITSCILTVSAGYRSMALIGIFLTAVGYLGAAFCDISNISLISFLYGALPGIGHNLIEVAILAAVLQYFRRRRLLALFIVDGGALLGVLAASLMSVFFTGFPGINIWKSYLLVQAGAACVMIPCSLILKPLNTRMKRPANQSLISYVMGMDELKVFRSLLLYVFAVVCCLWDGGISVIETKLLNFKGLLWILPTGQMLMSIILLASLVGACISGCICSNICLKSVVIAMAVFSGILFLLNITASLFYDTIYTITYSVLVGMFKGFGNLLVEYSLPLFLGEENVAIGAAIMTSFQSIGKLLMPAIADEIEKSTKDVDMCFYFAGVIIFVSASAIVLAYRLHLRVTKWVVVSDNPDKTPTKEPECTGVVTERF